MKNNKVYKIKNSLFLVKKYQICKNIMKRFQTNKQIFKFKNKKLYKCQNKGLNN